MDAIYHFFFLSGTGIAKSDLDIQTAWLLVLLNRTWSWGKTNNSVIITNIRNELMTSLCGSIHHLVG